MIVRTTVVASVLVCLGLLNTGCSHITMLRTEELREVQAHVDTLKMEMTAVQEEMLQQQKAHNELLRLIRADQQVRFIELSHKVNSIEGSLSESQQRLTVIDRKTEDLKERWDEKAREDSLVQSLQDAELTKLFQIAHDDFMARRYDLAIRGFEDIRNQYPDSPLAEDAAYWIAECYYAEGRPDEAKKAYTDYIKAYPEGKKMCVALFKLGKIFEKKGQDKSRRMVWKKLIERCPDSEEAAAAGEQM